MNEWNGIYCRYKMRAQRLWSGVSAMWTAISTIVYVWCVCVVHIYLARANGAPSVWASFGPPKWRVCWSLWITFFFFISKTKYLNDEFRVHAHRWPICWCDSDVQSVYSWLLYAMLTEDPPPPLVRMDSIAQLAILTVIVVSTSKRLD